MVKILIIDNDSQIRKLICQMLEHNSYEVSSVSDIQNGIDLFREKPTDVVLIDSLSSQKETIETIIELKRVYFDVAIIVMSRDNGTIDEEKLSVLAKPFGAVSALIKPFKQDDLLNAIDRTLQATEKYQKERQP